MQILKYIKEIMGKSDKGKSQKMKGNCSMKYFSEMLNEKFDTVEQLESAEKKFNETKLAKQEEEKRVSADKKELANKVSEAEKNLDDAYNKYAEAKETARKMLEESNKQISKVLEDAKKEVIEAEQKKYSAIADFNKKYGTYKVLYSGEKAAEEFNKASKRFSDFYNSIVDSFWRF